MHRLWAMAVFCVLAGCASGGGIGGSGDSDAVTVDDSSGRITLCSAVESPTIDLAVRNALVVWYEGIMVPWSTPRIPDEVWIDFQSVMLHEIGHALLSGFGDEHLDAPSHAVMHHSMCVECIKRHLTPHDLALVDAHGGLLDAVYLGHQTDRSLCTYTVRYAAGFTRAGRVTDDGWIEVRWDLPWLFPRVFDDPERA